MSDDLAQVVEGAGRRNIQICLVEVELDLLSSFGELAEQIPRSGFIRIQFIPFVSGGFICADGGATRDVGEAFETEIDGEGFQGRVGWMKGFRLGVKEAMDGGGLQRHD
ncbi:hypothetical protein [Rhizobium herbae]